MVQRGAIRRLAVPLALAGWLTGCQGSAELDGLLLRPQQSDIDALQDAGTEGVVKLIGWLEFDCLFRVQEYSDGRKAVQISMVGLGTRREEIQGLEVPRDWPARPVVLQITHPDVIQWAIARGDKIHPFDGHSRPKQR